MMAQLWETRDSFPMNCQCRKIAKEYQTYYPFIPQAVDCVLVRPHKITAWFLVVSAEEEDGQYKRCGIRDLQDFRASLHEAGSTVRAIQNLPKP